MAPRAERPNIVSISVGGCEAYTTIDASLIYYEKVLKRAALNGVSVFVAAGDQGVTDCAAQTVSDVISGSGIGLFANLGSVDYPGSSAWVTDVGGTNLLLSADNSIDSEIVWNNPNYYGFIDVFPIMSPGAGGGGVSELFMMPKWQQAVKFLTQSGYTTRAVPDIAVLADNVPGYINYGPSGNGSSSWIAVGGTSAGAPLMAASTALMNQALRKNKRSRVGFLSPAIYDIASNPKYASEAFNDVTSGNNNTTWQTPLGGYDSGTYNATVGFDLASGWGSPRFPKLLEALIAKKK